MPTHLWQGQGGGRREQGQGIPTPTTCRGEMWYRAAAAPWGKQRSSNPGHQAQCSGTDSGCLHTDGDETPAQRSGCGHSGVPQHLWVQPSGLCTAQRGKAKGQLGVKSSPFLLLKPFPGERGKRCACQFGHMPTGSVCPRGVPILKSSTQRECSFETA